MSNVTRSKRTFQIVLAISALAPLLTGILGMLGIASPIYRTLESPDYVLLDSNLRFLNGISVGLGISIYLILPGIEKQTSAVRIICGAIFVGGIGRLFSIYNYGFPPFPFNVFIPVEILLPVLLVIWQKRISQERDS
ncbi:DUF4345 domain-containing protein [Dyadobacter crusticola]|uniref:DUF4345 domain-containing protein n=1 Tax=Dyadobacter crusticola TaxID=292407 RepID=UPI0004E1177F|nr:DUF4345 domain-containing protein [Dyadobacter crusticola]